MPHFVASQLNDIECPVICGDFEFICEAFGLFGDKSQSVILVKHKYDKNEGAYFLLLKKKQENKILVKYNKNLKVRSIEIAKQALSEYAKLVNAKIIFHNLNGKKKQDTSSNPYFLTLENFSDFSMESKNLSIEIGFGSGRHILDLAKNNPNCYFLGLEIYHPAITQVLKQINILGLQNLYILNADCRILFNILPSNIAHCIYLHFPIPWDKNPHKRVFSKAFLEQCSRILKKDGFLELRTDSKEYFLYSLNLAKSYEHIHIESSLNSRIKVISKYEARWVNQHKDIFNARFIFKDSIKDNTKHTQSAKIILESIDINKILQSNDLKFRNQECFLHIKNIYKYHDGYILFIIFGELSMPNKIYIVISNDINNLSGYNVNILGDVIPSKANINALKMLVKLYGV